MTTRTLVPMFLLLSAAGAAATAAAASGLAFGQEAEPFPAEEVRIDGDANRFYVFMGPKKETKRPKDGFGLVVVLPGGSGGADFKGFVGRIYEQALGDDVVVAQLVAPKWTDSQTIVWPTERTKTPGMEFTTEEFVEAAVADVANRVKIDRSRVFVLAWSSSGPAAYSLSLKKKKSPTGFFIAMSVFRREWMPPLDEAKGEAYFLLQSPDDEITKFADAEDARKALEKEKAKVTLVSYPGGHGWHGNVYGYLRDGFSFLEKNRAKPGGR